MNRSGKYTCRMPRPALNAFMAKISTSNRSTMAGERTALYAQNNGAAMLN